MTPLKYLSFMCLKKNCTSEVPYIYQFDKIRVYEQNNCTSEVPYIYQFDEIRVYEQTNCTSEPV